MSLWQESAFDAMTAIGHRIDRERGGQPYFWTDLISKPPQLKHQSWDYCDMSGRWIDALIRGRLMTGSSLHLEDEEILKKFMLSRAGEDGLFYNEAKPEYGSTYAADMFCQSRVFLGLNTWFQNSGSNVVEGHLVRLSNRLANVAQWEGKYAWFPGSEWRDDRWLDADGTIAKFDPKVASALKAPGYRTTLLGGLVEYAELLDDKEAKRLALGLALNYIDRSGAIAPDGSYVGHTHSGGVLPTVLGVLRCGIALGDENLINWARKVYDFTITQISSFGWLADGIGFASDYFWGDFCETCGLADFIEIGILLTENKTGDYWNVVERCARNQLLENQIKDVKGLFNGPVSENLVAATIGSFACCALPNSYLVWDQGLEGCCIGSGIRAIYLFWRHGVKDDGQKLIINVPISRETEIAHVYSDDPFVGLLRIVMRRSGSVDLRKPFGNSGPIRITVNSKESSNLGEGEWFYLTGLAAGDEIIMKYGLPESKEKTVIAGKSYDLSWRGRTVMEINPPGKICLTYQRSNYLQSNKSKPDKVFAAEYREKLLPW